MVVTILDALIRACNSAYNQTKGIIGTIEAGKEFGIGAGGDITKNLDLVAEKAVIESIRNDKLSPTIIGEESGRIEGDKGFLIIDPVDGTANALRQIPFYCCSLAYAEDFKLSAVTDAVVMDFFSGDTYYASRGKGAFLNKNRISVRRTQDDESLLIGLNISGIPVQTLETLSNLISQSNHIRQFGANALEVSYIARGLLDAYIDFRGKIRATDMAGAYLILKEAGGKIYDMHGSELDSDLGVSTKMSFLATATDRIFERISNPITNRKR
jgi:myo-inositol-1(or 4)-monophosphatase